MDRAKYKIKNSAFEGVPVWVSWVSKVYFGVKTMCKKFHKVPTRFVTRLNFDDSFKSAEWMVFKIDEVQSTSCS